MAPETNHVHSQPATAAMTATVIPFHGDGLETIKDHDGVWLNLPRTCGGLGLAEQSQVRKLQGKPWAWVAMKVAHDAMGRPQQTWHIHIDSLPMWLATIEPSRVAEAIRPKLIAYQRECAQVLRDYWFKGAAVNPRVPKEDLEIVILRQKAAAELAILGKDFLDPRWVRNLLEDGINQVRGSADKPSGPLSIDLTTYLQGKGLSADAQRKHAGTFGKLVKAAYMAKHGREPGMAMRFVNGSHKPVCSYTEDDLPLLDEVFAKVITSRLT